MQQAYTADNETIPTIGPEPHCVHGSVNSVPGYIKITSAVTCALSMAGVMVILCTYAAYKRFRSKMREIVVHISLMDFTVASANLIGILVDFESRLYIYEVPYNDQLSNHNWTNATFPHTLNNLCIAQAAFAVYGTISSVLWTTSLTVYCYFLIIGEDIKRARRISYSFYIICYGIPVIIVSWLAITRRIGYSPGGGGGWCSLIVESKVNYHLDRFTIFLGYNLWMYITFIVVFTVTISILTYLKTQLKLDSMSHQGKTIVQMIEKKLLVIPILFLVLRIWSFLFSLITLYIQLESCTVVLFFLGMGAIGDSGQGFFNAIIFCFFNKKIRQSYRESITKSFRSKNRANKGGINDALDYDTVTAVGIDESQAENIEQSGSHELAKPYTRKWKEQSANYTANYNNTVDFN